MRELLVATRNTHKAGEIAVLLRDLPVRISSLADLGLEPLPGEDAVEVYSTFEENAVAKARFFRRHTGRDVVADDSGLCVDALGGAPGVRSRRFASDHGLQRADGSQDEANNDCLLRALRDVEPTRRGAHYACALACVTAERSLLVTGRVDGHIARQRRGEGGFGYDPLFVIPELGRTFGELPPDVKAQRSHRAEAIRSLRRWLVTMDRKEEPC